MKNRKRTLCEVLKQRNRSHLCSRTSNNINSSYAFALLWFGLVSCIHPVHTRIEFHLPVACKSIMRYDLDEFICTVSIAIADCVSTHTLPYTYEHIVSNRK